MLEMVHYILRFIITMNHVIYGASRLQYVHKKLLLLP